MMIADDPIMSCMERTGYPPWMQPRKIYTPFGASWIDYDEEEPDEEEENDD